MRVIETSSLFCDLSARHSNVECWADEEFTEGGWLYFWIVSRLGDGSVRNLAYVRAKGNELQKRIYDEAGDDVWSQID